MSKPMTTDEARAIFTKAFDAATDPDEKAKIELVREFFCNAYFAKKLSDYSFERTKARK